MRHGVAMAIPEAFRRGGSVFFVRQSVKYLITIIVGTTAVLVAVATGITAALLALPARG
jgi:hypothetical protein